MAIQTTWLIEPSVVQQNFLALPNLDELNDAGNTLSQFSRRNSFHLIADFSGITALPNNLDSLGEAFRGSLSRSRVEWFVTVGSHDVAMNFVAAMMPYFAGLQHKHFHSQAEALDFLAMMDTRLPMLF